jgi:hypothetical protein
MPKKDLADYKRKYDMYRHHAWAGGILLSVILAIRAFLEISDFTYIPDIIILPIGVILILYVLMSISFTYRYRSGLALKVEQKVIQVKTTSDDIKKEKIHAEIEKERSKLEKKKAKGEIKKQKKKNKKKEMGKTFK